MRYYLKKLLADRRMRRQQRLQKEKERQELAHLREELKECRTQIKNLESWFDLASDPYTIDSCIYQWCALQARYTELLQRVRESRGATVRVGSAAAAARIE